MPLPTSSEILATDQSKQILDTLFGKDWNLWGTGELAGAEGTSTNLTFQIFEAFNTVALAVVAGLFIFTTVLAVVGTAHEGSPMGKKYNAFWTPVRFVCSIAGLAPIFKGLSLFQVAILACIGWSINLGNYIYELGSNYYLKHTGEFQVQPINSDEYLRNVSNDILKSLSIQAYLKNERGSNIEIGSNANWHYDEDIIGTDGEWEYIFTGLRGKNDALGYIVVECASEKPAIMNLCNSNKKAIENVITSLIPLASSLANPKISSNSLERQALYNAEKTLSNDILSGVNQYINNDQSFKNKLTSYYNSTSELGWIAAGATYWAISWINQETKNLMTSNIDSVFYFNAEDKFLAYTYGLQSNNAILNRIDNFIASAYGIQKGIEEFNSFGEAEGFWGSIIGFFTDWLGEITVPYLVEELRNNDPIMLLSAIGNQMVNGAIGLFMLIFGGSIISGSFGQVAASFGLFAICTPLFLYGIYLAFWLPSIPFIRWVSGLFGWIILVIEALIAAPLWIAAHALPEGEGFAGNHARRGYFLLMAIIIRPALMVAGFFIAIISINIIGQTIGAIFILLFNTTSDYAIGIIGTICFIVILGSVIIMAANKIFGLITWLPDHVSNWIGQQLHSLGEDNDVSTAKGAFSGSTNIITAGRINASPLGVKFGQKNSNKIEEENLR